MVKLAVLLPLIQGVSPNDRDSRVEQLEHFGCSPCTRILLEHTWRRPSPDSEPWLILVSLTGESELLCSWKIFKLRHTMTPKDEEHVSE